MKIEIYKLQVTQYGHSEGGDNADSKSDYSVNSYQKSNQFDSTEEVSVKLKKNTTGFELPFDSTGTQIKRNRSPGSSGNLMEQSKYSPTETKKSLVSVGKSLVESQNSIYSSPMA